ncbi:MAG: CatB-related O-acetyltransferase [Bacteroidota bacterium]|nr:CatB-related O-acetyltransferase [Kiloniellaceae bacterium]
MTLPDGRVVTEVVHLARVIDHPRIEVGDFSYYHDFEVRDDYAGTIAPYLFPFSSEKLIIGCFVQIAHGTRFVTASANHALDGFSTYPFRNFMMSADTTKEEVAAMLRDVGAKGDTVVGNDVWLGMEAMVMPGVTLGDGAIVAARAVVTKDVAPYTVVAGNPARPVKQRFPDDVVQQLLEIRWWDWPVERIEANLDAILGHDLAALTRAADEAER